MEVKKQIKDYIDLQLVAFPQDGLYRAPKALENTIRALDLGVDIVGGIPISKEQCQKVLNQLKPFVK